MHLTGITTALGHDARELVHGLAEQARARGITVLLDPNYRAALWSSPADAAAALPQADWFLCGLEEGNLLFGTSSPEELAAAIGSNAAIRVGERGALVTDGGRLVEVAPRRLEDVVDEVGAGDGFAAGFAYGLLERLGRRPRGPGRQPRRGRRAQGRRRLGDLPATGRDPGSALRARSRSFSRERAGHELQLEFVSDRNP